VLYANKRATILLEARNKKNFSNREITRLVAQLLNGRTSKPMRFLGKTYQAMTQKPLVVLQKTNNKYVSQETTHYSLTISPYMCPKKDPMGFSD